MKQKAFAIISQKEMKYYANKEHHTKQQATLSKQALCTALHKQTALVKAASNIK